MLLLAFLFRLALLRFRGARIVTEAAVDIVFLIDGTRPNVVVIDQQEGLQE